MSIAIRYGNYNVASYFLDKGVNPNIGSVFPIFSAILGTDKVLSYQRVRDTILLLKRYNYDINKKRENLHPIESVLQTRKFLKSEYNGILEFVLLFENETNFEEISPFIYFDLNPLNYQPLLEFFFNKNCLIGKLPLKQVDEKGRNGLMRAFLDNNPVAVISKMLERQEFKELIPNVDKKNNSILHYLVYLVHKASKHDNVLEQYTTNILNVLIEFGAPLTKNQEGFLFSIAFLFFIIFFFLN